jgi:hypothetical protein
MNPIILLLAVGVAYLTVNESTPKGNRKNEQRTNGNDRGRRRNDSFGGTSKTVSESSGSRRVTSISGDQDNDGNELQRNSNAITGQHGDYLHGELNSPAGDDQGEGVTPTVSLLKVQ